MVVNFNSFSSPFKKNQTSFGRAYFGENLTVEQLQAIVQDLTYRVQQNPYNRSLKAKLRDAKEALEEARARQNSANRTR